MTDSSLDLCFVTGAFGFSSLAKAVLDFDAYFSSLPLVNDEKYLDSLFSFLVDKEKNSVSHVPVTNYSSLGTPDEYQSALYWSKFLSIVRKFAS